MILLIGIAYGTLVTFNLTDATFTPKQITEPTRYKGNINFTCGGENMSIYLDEPNLDIDDDFEEEVKKICNKQVANVIDWTGRKYKQNEKGTRSFDENIIKRDTCSNEGLSYNLTIKECYNATKLMEYVK